MIKQVQSASKLEKFRMVLEHAPVSVFIMDKNWNFEFINPEFEKLSGFTSEELLNKNIGETLYKNVQGIPESRREIITHLNEGKSWKGELLTINKNGSTYWAETTASPYKNENGDIDGYIVIQNDVTESRRMQEALQKSERRFRELTEMLPQAIYELDANNQPLFMNRAGLNMFGLVPGAASQRKKAFDFFSPGDTQKMKKALDRESKNIRYENGVIQPFASEPTEYMANKTDGSTFPVIVYGTPIVEDGKVTGSRGIIIDISERKAMENALRESEKKYKTLVENSLDGIIIVRNNQILFMNDTFCNMLGHSCEVIYNSPSTNFIHPDDRERAMAISEQRKQGNFTNIHENFRLLRADGKEIDCEVFSSLIEYDGLPAVFFTIHDVTENRRMQKALEESEILYRTLIEKSQDGVVLTLNREFYLVNQAFCTIMGYTREEIMNMNPIELLAPDHREKVLMMHDKRMNGEMDNSMNYSAIFIHKTGKRLTVELNSSTVQIEGQNLSFVTLRDITKRIQLQEELERSEQKYRQLTEMLPQTIYELDIKGNITYMNQTGYEKFGINRSDMGTPAFNFIAPEQHDMMRYNMRKSLEENYHTPGNSYIAVKKSGEKFPAMIFASPLKTKDGVMGTRGIILDMTEHEAMEKALRESEEKYRNLIDNATDGIVITQNGVLKFANNSMCDMMQYPADEITNRSFFEFVIPEDHEEMLQYHKRRMKGEVFSSLYRSHFIRKDKKIITVELNARTFNYEGKPAAFIVIRDITDRLIIENELRLAKDELEVLNKNLEARVRESSENLTEARTQLIRLQKENLQSQFEVLRQQVNPHFLFNSLNVLTSLIKLEPDLAEKFTEHLSKVYRYVLENKDNDLVELKTELDFLDAYLFLLNIRFMDKIVVRIQIKADKTEWFILPLALQLLIENAIKHNAMSKKNPLNIHIYTDSDNFLCVVNNLQERESYIASTGVGLKNIEHRYQLLEMPAPEFIKTEFEFIAKIPLRKI
jgi:PAS domain S-box-containing protein